MYSFILSDSTVSGCTRLPDIEGKEWVTAIDLSDTNWNETQFIIHDSSWKLQAYCRLQGSKKVSSNWFP